MQFYFGARIWKATDSGGEDGVGFSLRWQFCFKAPSSREAPHHQQSIGTNAGLSCAPAALLVQCLALLFTCGTDGSMPGTPKHRRHWWFNAGHSWAPEAPVLECRTLLSTGGTGVRMSGTPEHRRHLWFNAGHSWAPATLVVQRIKERNINTGSSH